MYFIIYALHSWSKPNMNTILIAYRSFCIDKQMKNDAVLFSFKYCIAMFWFYDFRQMSYFLMNQATNMWRKLHRLWHRKLCKKITRVKIMITIARTKKVIYNLYLTLHNCNFFLNIMANKLSGLIGMYATLAVNCFRRHSNSTRLKNCRWN